MVSEHGSIYHPADDDMSCYRAYRHQQGIVYEIEYGHVRRSAFSAHYTHPGRLWCARLLSPAQRKYGSTFKAQLESGTHKQLFVHASILQRRQFHVVQQRHSPKCAIRVLELCEPETLRFVRRSNKSLERSDRTARLSCYW